MEPGQSNIFIFLSYSINFKPRTPGLRILLIRVHIVTVSPVGGVTNLSKMSTAAELLKYFRLDLDLSLRLQTLLEVSTGRTSLTWTCSQTLAISFGLAL